MLAVSALFLYACVTPATVDRQGTNRCWVRFELKKNEYLCVSRTDWIRWLGDPEARSLCGTWPGEWKVSSPLLNSPGTNEPKTIRRTFFARGIPAGGEQLTLRERVGRQLEITREKVFQNIENSDSLGIHRKLLLDQKSSLEAPALLRILGFVDGLVATGIHLYALGAYWGWLSMRVGRFAGLSVDASLGFSRLATLLTWLLAWLLCGARPGMLRPFLVVLLQRLSHVVGFRWRRWSPLALALAVDLAVAMARSAGDAGGAWAPGRWYYALAVGGGILAHSIAPGSPWALAVGSWLGPALLEAWTQGNVSLVSAPLSILVLPIFTLLIYPGSLLSLAADSRALPFAAELATEILTQFMELTLRVPAVWIVSHHTLLAGACVSLILLLIKGHIDWRIGTAAMAVFGLSHTLSPALVRTGPSSSVKVEQLDVGQGDAALVHLSNGGTALIDTGSGFTMSATRWFSLLSERGITRLDRVLLSHLDEDHAGSLESLTRIVPIGCIAAAAEHLGSPRGRNFSDRISRLGLPIGDWNSGCAPFPVLPPGKEARANRSNEVMSSFAVPLEGGGVFISPGDALPRDELRVAAWVDSLSLPEGPRILKISHHGSRFSTDPRFLDQLRPTEAWISSGNGNRHGHPAPVVLERLHARGIPVRRTDQEGVLGARKPPNLTYIKN